MPVNDRRAARRRRSPALLLACVGLCLLATPAHARTAVHRQSSNNWSGYADTARAPVTAVSGSWVQPGVTCGQPFPTYTAFWVGLGGFLHASQHLEQVGTEADCLVNRHSRAYAWYEIVPAPPVRLPLQVRPGDRLAAQVTVSGQRVRLRIRDLTTARSATRTVSMPAPDTSSAEWIAEAPSDCNGGNCQPLPLANFGTVTFSDANATSVGRAPRAVNSSGLTPTAITLAGAGPGFGSAVPTALIPSGTGFSVNFKPATSLPGGPAPPPVSSSRLRHAAS